MNDVLRLKAELLCSGFRVNQFSDSIATFFNPHKQKRTGFVGVHLSFGGVAINALMDRFYENDAIFTNGSVFELKQNEHEWWIFRNGVQTQKVAFIDQPRWYAKTLRDSLGMADVFLAEGFNNLMGALSGVCVYHLHKKPCSFCGLTQARPFHLDPTDFAKTIAAAYAENPKITVTINGGNKLDDSNGMSQYIVIAKAINDEFDKQFGKGVRVPLQIECSPSRDITIIDKLIDLGVGSFSMNFEFYDENTRKVLCPMKGEIPRNLYEANWKRIVDRLGRFKVASVLIYGLDTRRSLLDGSQYLLDIGVFPNISPFRPMPGSTFEKRPAPAYTEFLEDSMIVAEQSLKAGVDPAERLGCFTCGSCSIERDCMNFLLNKQSRLGEVNNA